MSKNTSVTLGEMLKLDERERKESLKEAIEAGEKSGYKKNFDSIQHLEELNEFYSRKNIIHQFLIKKI